MNKASIRSLKIQHRLEFLFKESETSGTFSMTSYYYACSSGETLYQCRMHCPATMAEALPERCHNARVAPHGGWTLFLCSRVIFGWMAPPRQRLAFDESPVELAPEWCSAAYVPKRHLPPVTLTGTWRRLWGQGRGNDDLTHSFCVWSNAWGFTSLTAPCGKIATRESCSPI